MKLLKLGLKKHPNLRLAIAHQDFAHGHFQNTQNPGFYMGYLHLGFAMPMKIATTKKISWFICIFI